MNTQELPKYKSHKTVWALKIKKISLTKTKNLDQGAIMEVEGGYLPLKVNSLYMRKHKPESGGYWLKYKDGYESYSPAEAFESGYTLCSVLEEPQSNSPGPFGGLHLGRGNFGQAIQALKSGLKVSRSGWDGKKMWLSLVKQGNYFINPFPHLLNDTPENTLSWIGMKTADNSFVPWLASQTDMLSEDWGIVK